MKKIKKIEFFSYPDWKKYIFCVILTALFAQSHSYLYGDDVRKTIPKPAWKLEKELAETEKRLAAVLNEKNRLEAEVKTLQYENSLIRKELIETLDKYSMLAGKLKRWELSVAAVIETLRPNYTDTRAEDTAESLRTVMQSSVALASSAAVLSEEVDSLLQNTSVAGVRAAKLRVMNNSLKNEIRNIVRYQANPPPPQGIKSCRILNTDDKLKAAVFSAGYRNGLRAGMLLCTPDGNTQFQIILLKDFTSVGLLLKGDLSSVSMGSEVITSVRTAK